MDLSAYKYRSTFTSIAKVVNPTEEDRFIAKASLAPLRNILPADIDLAADPDLLYIACDGATAGLCNKNNDAITAETAVQIHGSAKNKFISTDHDRGSICGVVLHPQLTRLDSHAALTDEEALALKEPFYMSFVGALWKSVNPLLAKYLVKTGDSLDDSVLSVSWEVAFNEYSIGVGSKNLIDAKIITAADPNYEAYAELLLHNKGPGKDKSGNTVYRVLDQGALILGYSVVSNPAGNVKGILPLEPAPEPVETEAAAETSVSVTLDLEHSTELFLEEIKTNPDFADMVAAVIAARTPTVSTTEPITEVAASVSPENLTPDSKTPNTLGVTHSTTMITIKSKEDIASKWDEIRKLESCASITEIIDAIEQGSKQHIEQRDAALNSSKAAEEARIASEARATALEQSVAQLQAQLDEVRASAEAAERQAKYGERMASFDEVFDLGDEERKLIAAEVLAIETDEAFATCLAKYQTLMAAKKKGKFVPFEKKDGDKDGDDDSKMKEGKKESCASVDTKAALASVTAVENQVIVPNTAAIDETILDKMTAAFASALKINGKSSTQK